MSILVGLQYCFNSRPYADRCNSHHNNQTGHKYEACIFALKYTGFDLDRKFINIAVVGGYYSTSRWWSSLGMVWNIYTNRYADDANWGYLIARRLAISTCFVQLGKFTPHLQK
jgi:hypothetical protein